MLTTSAPCTEYRKCICALWLSILVKFTTKFRGTGPIDQLHSRWLSSATPSGSDSLTDGSRPSDPARNDAITALKFFSFALAANMFCSQHIHPARSLTPGAYRPRPLLSPSLGDKPPVLEETHGQERNMGLNDAQRDLDATMISRLQRLELLLVVMIKRLCRQSSTAAANAFLDQSSACCANARTPDSDDAESPRLNNQRYHSRPAK
uniref:Uncharacterized protein n=1 Tax=Mycena chlorophos TaxID=658473 RepID=A0ABQ0LUM4_MYCCL|nr:predicted protein [Mycena chlorophos]